jgi:hypothetical protein
MHLNDGQLRARLDGQADSVSEAHLASCPDCRARLADLEARAARVTAQLAALAPRDSETAQPAAALNRFKSQIRQKEKDSMSKTWLIRWRPALAGLVTIALAVTLLSFAPVRALATQFLGLFRVQQIAVLPVDTTRLSELNSDSALSELIGQFFADSMKVTKEPGEPAVAASPEEAGQLAGFTVRVWSGAESAPQITVQDGTAFEFTINRDRAQAILDEAGRSDLQLPASLDGAEISVEIPAGVSLAYGACPSLSGEETERLYWNQLRTCIILAQIPSPTVNAPADLDVAQLAEIGLQFTGMTAEEARAFSQNVDWASTLVVPIPRNGHSYEQVEVDGVTGNLIFREAGEGPARYTLLWVKNGIIYAISGFDDPQAGLDLANSLK